MSGQFVVWSIRWGGGNQGSGVHPWDDWRDRGGVPSASWPLWASQYAPLLRHVPETKQFLWWSDLACHGGEIYMCLEGLGSSVHQCNNVHQLSICRQSEESFCWVYNNHPTKKKAGLLRFRAGHEGPGQFLLCSYEWRWGWWLMVVGRSVSVWD